MNGAIYKQPLVLFLGAGASVPLGRYATVQFWEAMRWQTGVDRALLDSVASSITASQEIGSKPDVEAVLDCLRGLVEGKELLEKHGFEVTGYYQKTANEYTTEPLRLQPPYDKFRDCAELYDRLRDLVVSHYSEIVPLEAFELYRPFLELAARKPLPVFTTNYDVAIEKAYEAATASSPPRLAFNLVDGFARTQRIPEWSALEYDRYKPTEEQGAVILFKLHGSVDWVRTPSQQIQRIDIPERKLGQGEKVIAYPSRLKREIHEEPYRTSYDYLLACLLQAKVCAVIGFSFRDQEIVEEFRQAMQLNEGLKLIIVDPQADTIEHHLRGKLNPTSTIYRKMLDEFQRVTAPRIAKEILAEL